MTIALVLLAGTFLCLSFAWLGGYIAEQKGRSSTEGCLLGLLFGPFGALVALLLPTVAAKPVWRCRERPRDSGWQPPKEDDPAEDLAIGYLSDPRQRINTDQTATRSRN